ncbi:MAG: hypothetical protein QG565_846 [Campylobacterota bacterium]|nr:hypothetical protein [Campylobacterota bacterium]MDQ1338264.1 hypothetical protein [Campylobacterota bacterium]
MKRLYIAIDSRYCNEKKVCIENFENTLKKVFSKYDVQCGIKDSDSDIICTNGCYMFEIENPMDDEQNNIQGIIKKIFDELVHL